MKVLKKESEAIQQTVREALALLKQAHDKLDEVYDSEGVMQINSQNAGECVFHAGVAIESAAAWLTLEVGHSERGMNPTPWFEDPAHEVSFDF